MLGYKRIPDEWKSGIDGIADKKFSYTDFTFKTIIDSTYNRTLALARDNGGKVSADALTVRIQKPKAAKLEVWDDYGSPVDRIATTDSRWNFTGSWKTDKRTRSSSTKGDAAEIAFEGTGAMVVGPYLPNGGKADILLDGKLVQTVDVYPDESRAKGGESVWHSFGLSAGKHTLKVVVRGETYPGSTGSEIGITDLVVFR